MCPCKCPVRMPRWGAVTVFKSKAGVVGNNMIGQTQASLIRLPPDFGSDHKLARMVRHENAAFHCTQK